MNAYETRQANLARSQSVGNYDDDLIVLLAQHAEVYRDIRPQKLVSAQKRELPTDPKSRAAKLAVRRSLQIRPEQAAAGREHLLRPY